MVAARFRCKLRARRQRGALRVQRERGAVAPAGAEYYARLLREHYQYYTEVPLTANDLSPEEKHRQRRCGFKERYAHGGRSVYMEGCSRA